MKRLNPSFVILITAVFALFISFTPHRSGRKHVKASSADSMVYTILVDKSDYELKVFDDEGWYATYPVVFGSKDFGDKMREGDKKTPNGKYKIILKKHINYFGILVFLTLFLLETKESTMYARGLIVVMFFVYEMSITKLQCKNSNI